MSRRSTHPKQHSPTRRRFLQQTAATIAALTLKPSTLLADPAETIVTTPSGKLRGETVDNIRIFRGVPFAQPPTGSLRFQPPLPIQPWKDTRDATRFARAAYQPNQPALLQSEDCLYLNIWAPATPGPHPVFVWIHGGGYTGGYSFAPISDGSVFARQDIVVVTVAYRLGVLGFMDLSPLLGPTYVGSGNNAMRDLTASLEWIHHNIESFGGDPARITVGGQSAGAKATAALMAIPRASTLFHSAISESGGGERVLTHDQGLDVAQQFGRLWRNARPDSAPGFADLLTASPLSLIATQLDISNSYPLHFPFRPVVDSYLTARPVDLVNSGAFRNKRLLIGTNRDESASFLGPHPAADPVSSDLGNLGIARFNQVLAQYAVLYPDMPVPQRRIRAATAEEYWIPSIRLADAQSSNDGPTWMYRFDYSVSTGAQANEAHHSLELGLVWQRLDSAERSDPNAAPLSTEMHQAWASFIQGNTPTAPGLPQWPRYDTLTRSTMIFAPQPSIEQNPNAAERKLWDGIL